MKLQTIFLGLFFSGIVNATVINVDFDSKDSIDSFNTQDGKTTIDYLATGGIGGSGAVSGWFINSTFADAVFDFSNIGTEITLSAFYKMSSNIEASAGSINMFGELTLVTDANSYIFDDNVLFANVGQTDNSVRLFGGALQTGGGSFSGFKEEMTIGTILADHWYQFGVTFKNLGGQIGYDLTMSNYGLDGTSFVSEVINSKFITNDTHNIGSDKSVYGGMQVLGPLPNRTFGEAVAVDNFSISYSNGVTQVPEPSSIILFGLAMSILIRLSSNRKLTRN